MLYGGIGCYVHHSFRCFRGPCIPTFGGRKVKSSNPIAVFVDKPPACTPETHLLMIYFWGLVSQRDQLQESFRLIDKPADLWQPLIKNCWLVVSNIWNMFHNIWDVILPIDELHHFSRWLLHHQPDCQLVGKTQDLELVVYDSKTGFDQLGAGEEMIRGPRGFSTLNFEQWLWLQRSKMATFVWDSKYDFHPVRAICHEVIWGLSRWFLYQHDQHSSQQTRGLNHLS